MHAQLDSLRGVLGDSQQLDAVAELLGIADVRLSELRDSFPVALVELHRDAEGDRRHDGELVRGVHALDVEGRIRLGIAAFLRLLQHRRERKPLVAHLREDEVRGAVDDSRDPLDAVRGEAFAQRLDDGNAARDRAFERDHHALPLRGGEDLVAVGGEQRLVRSDHVLAAVDRGEDQIFRDRDPADQLDHDVDLGIAHHFERVRGDARLTTGQLLRLRRLLVGDDADADVAAGAARDLLPVTREHRPGASAHRADAEQPHVDRLHLSGFLK